MFLDAALILSNAQAITSTAASTNIYDVTGAGSGVVPNLIWGTTSVFGSDEGIGEGKDRPCIILSAPVAFVSGGGATMQISIQAAIDSGTGGVPGTYYDLWSTDALTVAQLASLASQPYYVPLPPVTPNFTVTAGGLPRFYRMNYTVATSTFSAGKLTAAICQTPPTFAGIQLPSNFGSV